MCGTAWTLGWPLGVLLLASAFAVGLSGLAQAAHKHSRRWLLKALPTAGATLKWIADKLGGAALTGTTAWVLDLCSQIRPSEKDWQWLGGTQIPPRDASEACRRSGGGSHRVPRTRGR